MDIFKRLIRIDTLLLAACLALPLSSAGCSYAIRASTEDLQRWGTKTFSDRSVDQVRAATVTALQAEGFTVVATTPRIQTAPKVLQFRVVETGPRANRSNDGVMETWA